MTHERESGRGVEASKDWPGGKSRKKWRPDWQEKGQRLPLLLGELGRSARGKESPFRNDEESPRRDLTRTQMTSRKVNKSSGEAARAAKADRGRSSFAVQFVEIGEPSANFVTSRTPQARRFERRRFVFQASDLRRRPKCATLIRACQERA